jgi:hypothetical protein
MYVSNQMLSTLNITNENTSTGGKEEKRNRPKARSTFSSS